MKSLAWLDTEGHGCRQGAGEAGDERLFQRRALHTQPAVNRDEESKEVYTGEGMISF